MAKVSKRTKRWVYWNCPDQSKPHIHFTSGVAFFWSTPGLKELNDKAFSFCDKLNKQRKDG